ncbi:MAG: HD domain-containing protein [Spirochaetales bacterium]|nr:HD domain-containing protein [Spirochaetales bacterium]
MALTKEKLKRVRILIVDDEKSVLELYLHILKPDIVTSTINLKAIDKPQKHKSDKTLTDIMFCQQGREAIEAVRKSDNDPFSIVFLDVHLSSSALNGIQIAEKIREFDRNIQIVLITGDSTLDMTAISDKIRPSDKLFYLNKPFKPIEIRQFVDSLTAKWISEKQLSEMKLNLENLVEERTSELTDINKKLIREVDQRQKIEHSLRTSEENFKQMIIQNADGIVIVDNSGYIQFVNPAAEKLFSQSAEKMVGTNFGYNIENIHQKEIEIESLHNGPTFCELHIADIDWLGNNARMASLRDVTGRKVLEEKIKQGFEKLQIMMKGTIQVIARLLETKDPYTAGHQKRVSELALALAEDLHVDENERDALFMAALIHDIGKISIPSEILSKPGKLNEIEYDLIKTHSQIGFEILKEIDFPWPVADIVRQHHEKLDGTGYPQGIKSSEILHPSKILAVADVVEAISSHRPYRAALGVDVGLEHILENSGILYDEEVVNTCVTLFREKNFEFKTTVWKAMEYSDPRHTEARA